MEVELEADGIHVVWDSPVWTRTSKPALGHCWHARGPRWSPQAPSIAD